MTDPSPVRPPRPGRRRFQARLNRLKPPYARRLAALAVVCSVTLATMLIGMAVSAVAEALAMPRHAHRKTKTDADPADAPPTSIDYLGLLGTAHDRDLRDRLNFSALLEDQDQHHDKGQ
jgi:hypothetical protein